MIGWLALGEQPFATARVLSAFLGGDSSVSVDFRLRLLAATRDFATEPTDAMPNVPFDGTLQQSLRLDRSIVGSDGFGKVSTTWGELELGNIDGRYDDLLQSYSIDGRRVIVRAGAIGRPYDRFYPVFSGTATAWTLDEDLLRISLRDNSFLLEVPASPNLYAGTGDLQGGKDLKGKRRPLCFGYVSNVSPPLVIPVELLFQVHDGRTASIPAVYDRGSLLTSSGDYPSSGALRAATIPPGQYATCAIEGLFRLGGAAVGQITADVLGDARGGIFVSSTADIIRRLLVRSTKVSDPGDLLLSSFATLNEQNANPVGYWVEPDSSQTVREVVDLLLTGVGAWGDFRRDGFFKVARFDAPVGTPAGRYAKEDIFTIQGLPLPEAISPPPWRFRVTWGWNWTVQDDVVGTVGAARIAYLAQQFRTATPTLSTLGAKIKGAHPLAQDPQPIQGYFLDAEAAAAEADRRLALYGVPRSLYRIAVGFQAYAHDLGDVVHLTYPRWDLAAGKLVTIVAMSEDPDNGQVELTVFG
jgi:hypothetical protein